MRIRNTRELAAVARARRRELGWSQVHTAAETGVSREWLIEFEKAKSTVELGMVLRLLRVLEIGIFLDAGSGKGKPIAIPPENARGSKPERRET